MDKTDEEFEIAVTPSPKATVRVGYYNADNKWVGSEWTKNANPVYKGDVKANDANAGKYLAEVRAESGDIVAHKVELRLKSAENGIENIVLNRDEVAHFNVDMSAQALYEAYLPNRKSVMEITPKDKYAVIESVEGMSSYSHDATPTGRDAEWDKVNNPDGTRKYVLKNGVTVGDTEYYKTTQIGRASCRERV